MNVFVLCTGRSGSLTWIKACESIENFTSAHESRLKVVGEQRLNYPPCHIEADNRLSWMLGRLDSKYGDEAFYVHLRRNERAVAESFVKRWDRGIIHAYRTGITCTPDFEDRFALCLDYCDTVNANIELFLKGKSRVLSAHVETLDNDFATFWRRIEAKGDLSAALKTLAIRHNAS